MEEWAEQNLIKGFIIPDELTLNKLKEKYKLHPLKSEDLYFTDELEDDRVNSTLIFSDYDWMNYKYDARFPTNDIGTLSVRFDYFGTNKSSMYVKQFLPSCLTSYDENYVLYYEFKYETSIFHNYIKKDLMSRIDSFDSPYAYNAEDLLLEWFNNILEVGEEVPCCRLVEERFSWESVRIPKK